MNSHHFDLKVESIQRPLQNALKAVDVVETADLIQGDPLAESYPHSGKLDITPEAAPAHPPLMLGGIPLDVECQKYRDLFEQAPDAYLVTTLEGVIQAANCAAEQLFRRSHKELRGRSLTAFMAQEHQPRFFTQLNQCLTSAGINKLEIAFQVDQNTVFTGSATVSVICDEQGFKAGLRWLIRDTSDDKKKMDQVLYDVDQVLYDTFHDRLTGLSNRALICEHLEHALARYRHQSNQLFALLSLDIDRFKIINDSLGHMAGDRLLMELASRLQVCVRPGDILARLEGDEFLLLLNGVSDISEAESCARQVQEILSAPYQLNGYKIVLQPSIGICLGSAHYQLASDLIRDANLAMCQAKQEGGACVRIFTPDLFLNTLESFQLEQELHRAVQFQEFEVFYQPVVSLNPQRLSGFEALVRWQHPQRGLLAPGVFLPAAEASGMIALIDLWMLRVACEQMVQWQAKFQSQPPLRLSVNISSQLFGQTGLSTRIQAILNDSGLDPACLTLEITEGVLMANVDEATSTLMQLQDLKVKLAIDDFGTGYSSLSRLQDLPFHCLKIDRSFLWSAKGIELVEPILLLAKTLGLSVVTEGVENQEQLQSLINYGCEFAQGYYFGFPVNSKAAEARISA